jgi:hypothetical protein
MPKYRPTPVLVIAILHLVGGGLGLFFSLCGCAGLLMGSAFSSFPMPTAPARPGQPSPPPPPGPGEVMKFYNENVPGYQAFTIGSLAVSFLLDGMLLAAGVGLLNMRPWARVLSLVYAPISIVNRLVAFVYQLVLVVPATEKLYAQNPALAGMSSFMSITSVLGLVVSLLFIIYPLTVLVILLMPSTAAAFRGEVPARAEDVSAEGSYPDDPWREPPRSDAITS